MALYPENLLPKQSYPILTNEDIADCSLIRETTIDLYVVLEKPGYSPDDILRYIIAPQPSLTFHTLVMRRSGVRCPVLAFVIHCRIKS
jgi:hypothetical protein